MCASVWSGNRSVRATFISSPHRHSGPSVQLGPSNRSNEDMQPPNARQLNGEASYRSGPTSVNCRWQQRRLCREHPADWRLLRVRQNHLAGKQDKRIGACPSLDPSNIHRPPWDRCMAATANQRFEWIEEGKPYREWLIPARIVNALGPITILDG